MKPTTMIAFIVGGFLAYRWALKNRIEQGQGPLVPRNDAAHPRMPGMPAPRPMGPSDPRSGAAPNAPALDAFDAAMLQPRRPDKRIPPMFRGGPEPLELPELAARWGGGAFLPPGVAGDMMAPAVVPW